jgi:hypothetical protein
LNNALQDQSHQTHVYTVSHILVNLSVCNGKIGLVTLLLDFRQLGVDFLFKSATH